MPIPSNPIQHNHKQASTSSNHKPFKSDESEKNKSTSQVHQHIVPFPNRLKNNKQNPHMDKIIEIFNQVKINLPLLDAIQHMLSFLRTCAPRRERLMYQKGLLNH